MIEFGKPVCSDLGKASSREWLETNGLGGFACSTIAGMNTRRYHGLLTAATRPPVGRVLLLSKLEETLLASGRRIDLSTNQYAGAVHPHGYELQTGFRLDPFPIFTYEWEGVRIEKSIFMVHESNTTVVEYRVLAAPPNLDLRLQVRPLIAFRDYHSTTHENGGLNPAVRLEGGIASVEPYQDLPRLYLAHNASDVETQGTWYRQFFYAVEAERGLDCVEDLFNPLLFLFDLDKLRSATLIASTEMQNVSNASHLRESEIARRQKIAASAPLQDPLAQQLALAADQYLTRRDDGFTLMAGYPWFTDWGRDTMITLPGLMHLKGSADWIKGILREFARHVDQGMLPNRFPDAGEAPEFNTVDATLWFFEATRAYLAHTGDEAFVRDELYAVLKDILDWHMRGTRYNIAMQEDGLLEAGQQGFQLTWMDAKIGDWVVTPRIGKPVEIQALWYNALKTMEEMANRFNDSDSVKKYRAKASLAQWTFNHVFWNAEGKCLYDVVTRDGPDASIRPNQIFAVSLHHSMLSKERAEQVLSVVERELLTPYGLRSLSPRDPQYKGRYEGDPFHRDSAYHQGTVWPWLLGHYITAFCKIHDSSDDTRQQARDLLKPLEAHLYEAGLGQISEIYDGDAPHRPRGCFAQAWSVGELLRVLCEDVYPIWSREHAAATSATEKSSRAASAASVTTSARASVAASFLLL
jgi:predicted glycogen debranching enzyme